jgi:hypothetical protein
LVRGPDARHRLRILAAAAIFAVAGCLGGINTLGGREKCWPSSEQRAPSVWRGILRIDGSAGELDTPEGEVIPLLPGALSMRVGNDGTGQLVRGNEPVAKSGDDVTLYGGAGADGYLVVCGLEEIHSRA